MAEEFEKIGEMMGVSPEYIDLVKGACNNNQNFFIENSSIAHAKFLSYFLMKRASNEINIFTGMLKREFYENDKMREKHNDGIKINVIVEKDGIYAKKVLSLAKEFKSLKIYKLNKNIKTNHFLLSDNNAFRVEEIHECNAKQKICEVHGIVNFSSENMASNLHEHFDNLLASSNYIVN
jgi:hypothetical protein